MMRDPALVAALRARGLVTDAMIAHVEDAGARGSTWTVSRRFVDQGYVAAETMADVLASLHGVPRWDGRPADPEVTRRVEGAHPRDTTALALDGGALVVATTDPGDGSDAETLRFASRARALRAVLVTPAEHARIVAPSHLARLREGLAAGDVDGVIPAILVGSSAFRAASTRLRAGPAPGLRIQAWGDEPFALPTTLAEAVIARLREMAAVAPDARFAVGKLVVQHSQGRLSELICTFGATEDGNAVHVACMPAAIEPRGPNVVVPAAVTAAYGHLERAKTRAELDAATTALVRATEPGQGDPVLAQEHLDALDRRVGTLLDAGRNAEIGDVVARALALCDARAPAARRIFAFTALQLRPRGTRTALLRALAEELRPMSPAAAIDALSTAANELAPTTHADVILELDREIEAIELATHGGASIASVDARARTAIARAFRGEPGADHDAERAVRLARALHGDGADALEARLQGKLLLVRGRPAEAEAAFRRAIALWASYGFEGARWATTIDLAEAYVALGRGHEARELVLEARSHGRLDEDDLAAAEDVLRAVAVPPRPYR
jgi:hypothetical protein